MPSLRRLLEERLRRRPRHLRLVEGIELGLVLQRPAGEEGRERQLGKGDEVAAEADGPRASARAAALRPAPRLSLRAMGPSWAAPTVMVRGMKVFSDGRRASYPLPRIEAGEGGDPSRSDGEGEGRASMISPEQPSPGCLRWRAGSHPLPLRSAVEGRLPTSAPKRPSARGSRCVSWRRSGRWPPSRRAFSAIPDRPGRRSTSFPGRPGSPRR